MKSLTDIIYQYKNKSFNWGTLDCCIFTAKVVEEYTGRDLPYWKDVLNYTDQKSSGEILSSLNCDSVLDLPTKILSKPKLPISEAKQGYPVYFLNEKDEGTLGICNGKRAYFLKEKKGLIPVKIEDCLYCWSID